jgi:hypothetical protein
MIITLTSLNLEILVTLYHFLPIQNGIRWKYRNYKLLHLKLASPCIIKQFTQINQLDATVCQVYYLTFMYSSTCFGLPYAHHQELNNCNSRLWFYRWSVVVAVLLVVVGLAGRSARPRPTALLPPRSNGKTRGCYCSCWAPDDGRKDALNMLSCT